VKKNCLVIGLCVVGVLLLALLIIVLVVDSKLGLFSGSEISHEEFATPDTRIRLVIKPSLFIDDIRDHMAPPDVPPWATDMALPHESAVLMDCSPSSEATAIRLFLNENRFGPLIVQGINDQEAMLRLPGVAWTGAMTRPKRGVLLKEGKVNVPEKVLSLVRKQWGLVELPNSLTIEGGHLLEAVLDNRDGGAYALIAAMQTAVGRTHEMLEPERLIGTVHNIASVRMTADKAGPDVLDIHLHIEGNPQKEEADIEALVSLLTFVYQASRDGLREEGIELTGTFERDGMAIEGTFQLEGYVNLLPTAR